MHGNGRLVIFKIGDNERPAGPKDIKAFRKQLKKCVKSGKSLVWNHAVQTEIIDGTNGVRENVLFQLYDRGAITKKELKKSLKA